MTINNNNKGDAFRLAAVLYADNNYEVNPKTLYRKIIETLFISNNNKYLSINDIIDQIEEKYDFIFSENEIEGIVKSHIDSHFDISSSNQEKIICLQIKRFTNLLNKINHKNIDYFINEFLKNADEKAKSKETIYRFLYEGFKSNVTSFSKMLDTDFNISNFITNLNHNFNNEESQLINDFLQWDNNDKNKSIFDISSFALEYCLITNKKSDAAFQVNNLKNKNFYLDTNVIFRAIGINGNTRKKRTLTFLEKFKEANEKLILTKYTEEEFYSSINHYLKEIEKNLSPKINSKVFLEVSTQHDFYTYYFRWKSKRTNTNLEIFKASIITSYEALKRKYKIIELKKVTYNETNEIYKNKIKELTEEIYTSKRYWSFNPLNVNYESIHFDAKNIFLIDKERENKDLDIFQTKHFFISTDQLLKKWDLERSSSTPTVILPSHWLTILLRYYSRTNDDFKSFVSFLSLSQNGSSISNKNLTNVLNGISEITTDMNEQSQIVNQLITQKFRNVIKEDTSAEEIIDNAKKYTKTILDKKVENLQLETSDLKNIISKTKIEVENLKNGNASDKKLKDKFKNKLVNEKYNNIRRWGILYLLIAIVTLFLSTLIFFYQENDWNFVGNYVKWANNLKDNSMQKVFASNLTWVVPTGIISVFGIKFFKVFFDENYIKEKKQKIANKIEIDKEIM